MRLLSSAPKVKGKGECNFKSVVGTVTAIMNGRAREEVSLLLGKRVLDGVV